MIEIKMSVASDNITYASLPERFCSVMIDYVVVVGVIFILIMLATNISSEQIMLKFWHVMAVEWFYFSTQHSSYRRATIGMRIMKLEIIDMDAQQINLTTASLRYCFSLVSSLVLWLGHWMMLTNPSRQTLHDKVAGTLVIKTNV